jgi:hypothetical protein
MGLLVWAELNAKAKRTCNDAGLRGFNMPDPFLIHITELSFFWEWRTLVWSGLAGNIVPPTIHTESMHVKLCNICKTAHVLAKECFL